MLLDQRRDNILEILQVKGFASVQDLMDELGASESTVRRDLEYLDRIGQIRRTRGGAAYVGESLTAFDDRRNRAQSQKQAIGRAAAEFIQSGETILLDGGTTTLEVARTWRARRSRSLRIPCRSSISSSPLQMSSWFTSADTCTRRPVWPWAH